MRRGILGSSWTGRVTCPVVRDGSGNPRGDQGWVGGTSRRFATGRGILGKIRIGTGDPLEGLDWVGDPPGGLTNP